MKRATLIVMCSVLVLGACGNVRDSRLNPRNWFSASTSEPTLGPTAQVQDFRPAVPQVASLAIERTSSGALVRASAVMPSGGWWDAELIPENNGRPVNGVLTYRFVAAAPRTPVQASSERARTITAAATISSFTLDEVTSVVVRGDQNQRSARR
jgi:hypothetical protein